MSDDTSSRPDTSNEDTQPMPAGGQSRRSVLKAAVIGSAAVAAVAGAGTAGLALTGKKLPIARVIGQVQISGQDPCSACVTGSQSDCNMPYPQLGCIFPTTGCAHPQFRIVPTGGGGASSNPGSFFVWVTVKNVPANDSLTMTFTLPSGFATQGAQPYFLYTSPAGTASTCPQNTGANCSNSSPVGSTFINNASTLGGLFPYAVGATSVDVQLMVHCDYTGGAIGNNNSHDFKFSFTASEKPVGAGPIEVCEDTFTITGVQKS